MPDSERARSARPGSEQPGNAPGRTAEGGRAPGRSRTTERGWSLEDAVPGVTIRHPGGRTISEAEHVWLAWVTHNVSDIHGNADSAARGEWGQPLVLGMLTAAIVIGLAEPAIGPAETAAAGLGVGWDAITLEHRVVAGDTLRAESLIERVDAREGADIGSVARTIVGRNQDGTVVARIRERREVRRRS